jgi:hypothetical protein
MLSRRHFLGLAGGAVLLAACGGDDDSSGAGTTGSTLSHDHPTDELTDLAPAVVSSDLHVSDVPQRFAFAVVAKEGFASQGAVSVALAPEGSTPTEFVPTTLYEAGLPARRGIYVTEMTFDREGLWDGIADRDGEQLPFVIQVKPEAQAPTIGAAAPTAASPTTTNTLDVDPICTRNPACDLHTTSLDTLIGKGRPVAVLFATPARCQTQYCGPVLDSLLPLVGEYRDRVDVLHVDIYLNSRTDEVAPTVAAWGLPSEPWLFGVDASGTITARLDGAFGQDEMRNLLEQLATDA